MSKSAEPQPHPESVQTALGYDPADAADCCGATGCRKTNRLLKIEGRVLCRQCAIDFNGMQG